MPTVRVAVVTSLDPAEVVRRLTDFGPQRADAWPNVDPAASRCMSRASVGPMSLKATRSAGSGSAAPGTSMPALCRRRRPIPTCGDQAVAGTARSRTTWRHAGRGHRPTDRQGLQGKLVGAVLAIFGKSLIKSGTAAALKPR